VSPFHPFGSTADSRSGKKGLPEAIAKAIEIEFVEPDEREYNEFRSQIAGQAPWVNATSTDFIEAELDASDVHRNDLSYDIFRREILHRLGEKKEMCKTSTGSPCHCERISALGIRP